MCDTKEKLGGSHGPWCRELSGKTGPWSEDGQEAGVRPWRTLRVVPKVVFILRMTGSSCKF